MMPVVTGVNRARSPTIVKTPGLAVANDDGLQRHDEDVALVGGDDLRVAGQSGPQRDVGPIEPHLHAEFARRLRADLRQRAGADFDDAAGEALAGERPRA